MKRTISLLIWFLPVFLASISLHASTTVSANLVSDTQWNQAGNPYLLSGNISVPQGVMLTIGPGVQVIFQGSAQMEVGGTLLVDGSAASPVVFNMTQGGLQNKFFLNGGSAHIVNAKFLGGIFLAKDSQFSLEGSDLTEGSGIYLQGANTAKIKSCKIYGNATGLVSDGKNKISMTFDTIVQNTYGLFLKSFSELDFKNNSIHDNQVEVINNTPPYKMGGNFWGTQDEKAVMAKIQGGIDLKPMKSLKDVLRVYVQSQLPEITEEMSNAMASKEKRQEKAGKLALKKLQEQEGLEALKAKQEKGAPTPGQAAVVSAPPAAPQPPSPQSAAPPAAQVAAPAPPPNVAQPPAPPPPAATAPELAITAPSGTIEVKTLPAAPHQLTPVALPSDQGNVAGAPVGPAPAMASPAVASSPAPPPEIPSASTGLPAGAAPAIPDSELMPPPPPSVESAPLPPANAPVASTQPAPEVNNVAPAAVSAASTNSDEIPPPPGTESSANAAPAGTASTAPSGNAEIPPPPPVESNTNVPSPAAPAIPSSDNIPSVPGSASAALAPVAVAPPPGMNSTANVPAPPAAAQPAPGQPSEDQKKAMEALQGVNGDIDGMQAPPLDFGVASSVQETAPAPAVAFAPATASVPAPAAVPATAPAPTTATATVPSSAPAAAPSSDKANQPADDSTLALPPLQDSEVKPPKDLDLPPTDDLGNVNLNSKNK